MNADKIQIDTNKVIDKVYHIKELHAIVEDIITDYINQVVLMDDKELKEDRSEWIKLYGDDDFVAYTKETYDNDNMIYDTSIHTLAIELEQLRRYKRIIYKPKKRITED